MREERERRRSWVSRDSVLSFSMYCKLTSGRGRRNLHPDWGAWVMPSLSHAYAKTLKPGDTQNTWGLTVDLGQTSRAGSWTHFYLHCQLLMIQSLPTPTSLLCQSVHVYSTAACGYTLCLEPPGPRHIEGQCAEG